ncbi:hypothetical protein BSL78_07309 [Apostichopus japonicus]|uniref:CYRIA/CYRIB Rac1 binding domain-containing protein n=1 Tax=Stichopus japonicus TaxID=307972 RepID=A0A2G8L6D3_STIJA|nr:hypothetical protein BSL78_07309 [Apostichopus japonicus]
MSALRPIRPTANEQPFTKLLDAQPTDGEKEIFDVVSGVLTNAIKVLEDLQQYQGAGDEIRFAISHPNNEEYQEKAWAAVCPLVVRLRNYYEYSIEVARAVKSLLFIICSTDMSAKEHLEIQQATAKQFAEILDFTLRFDDLKMTNPAIQNDFSYYRRTLSRMRMASQESSGDMSLAVNNEMANRMSLFYAQPTPMLQTLSDATTKFVSENKELPIENTTDILSTMTAVCRVMLENKEYHTRFQQGDTVLFVLRVMVGLIILYDHVHPVGAFDRRAAIDVKSCIKVLRDQTPNVEGLLNALRLKVTQREQL